MRRPGRLRAGDRVALVAPASGFRHDILERGADELRRLGLDPVYSPAILERTRFEAGPPSIRMQVLRDAWRDPEVRALVAVRGGYGSQRLLPLLEPAWVQHDPKLLIGYSDITALQAWLLGQGVASLHGPMLEGRLSEGETRYHRESFWRLATEAQPVGAQNPNGLEVLIPGEARGVSLGGTLTQVVSLLGTPWSMPVPRGAVLWLEDVNERPYRMHRMLTQLAQSGALARASAVIFGECPGCDEPGGSPQWRDVVAEFFQGFHGPVLFGYPFGHAVGAQWSVPFGVHVRVSGTAPHVVFDEALVN